MAISRVELHRTDDRVYMLIHPLQEFLDLLMEFSVGIYTYNSSI
jgi:hypothetical protein